MQNRYRFIDDLIDAIEGATSLTDKMVIIWKNIDNQELKTIVEYLYDYRRNFEIAKIPQYKRKYQSGLDLHVAFKALEQRLNNRLCNATHKYNTLVDVLQMMGEREATVFEKMLTGDIDLGIPLEDIQRAYPYIKSMPLVGRSAKTVNSIADLKTPGYVIFQRDVPEIRIICNSTGNFRFVGEEGQSLILPDKPKSVFAEWTKPLKNVVVCANLSSMTSDKKKFTNPAASLAAYTSLEKGELKDETIGIEILDVCTLTEYMNFPEYNQRTGLRFERRLNYINSLNYDSWHVAQPKTVRVESLEDLRKLENAVTTHKGPVRYVEADSFYSQGFQKIDARSF